MTFKKGETPKGAKPFKKGQSGNPNGRPEGAKSRSTILKYWLEQPLEILNPITKAKQKSTVEHEVMLALIAQARKGEIQAIKEVLDTMYGKLTDKVQIDVQQLDSDIEREMALIAAGRQTTSTDEAESETIN